MTLQWKHGSTTDQTASDIIASGDGTAYADETIRTLQVSEPGGYAVVTWEGKDGAWETWAWGDSNGWAFVAEFPSATKAKAKAQELTGEPATDAEKVAASAQETVESAQETAAEARDLVSDEPPQAPPRVAAAVAASTKAATAEPEDKAAPSAEPDAEAAPARTPPLIPKETLAAVTLVSDVGDPEQLNQQDALGRETVHGRTPKVEVQGVEGAPSVKVWRGDYAGNPPLYIPKKQRQRVAAVTASMDKAQLPQIQPSQA